MQSRWADTEREVDSADEPSVSSDQKEVVADHPNHFAFL